MENTDSVLESVEVAGRADEAAGDSESAAEVVVDVSIAVETVVEIAIVATVSEDAAETATVAEAAIITGNDALDVEASGGLPHERAWQMS